MRTHNNVTHRAATSFWMFFGVMVFVGLVGQWAGVATNRPILVELVPPGCVPATTVAV
jgi:hypothetical protein